MSKFVNWALGAVLAAMLLMGGCATATWVAGVYNRLVPLEQNVDSKWAQVQNVYQRRMDLVPNLVATVRGYSMHEHDTLQDVIQARANATKVTINPGELTPEKLAMFQQTQGELSSALARLMVVVEKYPELKANEGFLKLQVQLEGTENRIAVERKAYNEAVQEYNNVIKIFPTNIAARLVGKKAKPYFKADSEAQHAPQVDFSRPGARGK